MTTATLDSTTEFLLEQVDFTPTGPEQEEILACLKRFILVAGGEQAGKSLLASKVFLTRLPEAEPRALFWLIAADYDGTKAEFDYIAEDAAKLGILKDVSKRVDPGFILLSDNTRIETKSAKDPRTIRMRAPNGIIVCEASQIDLDSWMRVQGRAAPKRAWVFASGTFEGSLGWYVQQFKAWKSGADPEAQSFSLPSTSNRILYPGGENDPEIQRLKRESSDDFFLERIMGIPSPPKGIVFPEFRPDLHVRDVKFDPDLPVNIWVDPGYAGAYAVEAVQIVGDRIHVFDEVYERTLVTEGIIDIVRNKPWAPNIHPAGSVIDVAGYQHQAMSAPAEIWLSPPPKGMGLYLSAQKVQNVNDADERLKAFLKPDPISGEPGIVFAPHCRGILSEFGAVPNPFDGQTRVYSWKIDRDGNVVGKSPANEYNHGIKAVEYGIIDRYGYSYVAKNQKIKVKRW